MANKPVILTDYVHRVFASRLRWPVRSENGATTAGRSADGARRLNFYFYKSTTGFGNTQSVWLSPISGDWVDGTKWSTNPTFPLNNSYDAIISATGTSYSVGFTSDNSIGNVAISSAAATLYQSSGRLGLAGTMKVSAGTYQLSAGTLAGGRLVGAGGTVNMGGDFYTQPTLDGVTVAGTLTSAGYVNLVNGTTLDNATLNLGVGTNLWLTGPLTGTGQIVFKGVSATNAIAPALNASSMTIGQGITVRGNSTSSTTAVLGRVAAPFTNNGLIACDNATTTLNISSSNFTNGGAINLSAGKILLSCTTTTAQLGIVNRNGGSLILTGGLLDNTGGTLDLAGTGSLQLSAGTLRGGTVVSSNASATLLAPEGRTTLDGITLGVDLTDTPDGSLNSLTVKNGLTLQAHNLVFTSGTGVISTDASTYGGTGQIVVNNLVGGTNWTSNIGGTNVTIGPNVAIRTGTGASENNRIKVTTVLNQGTIAVGATATPMTVTNTIPWTNAGTLSVASSSLSVSGSWTNTGSILATGGTLSLLGTWSNPGTITATNAQLNIGGIGSGLDHISATNGGVVFGGAYTTAQTRLVNRVNSYLGVTNGGVIDNTGDTISVDVTTPFHLTGGTIRGGAIDSPNGGQVLAQANGSTLDTVTLNTPLTGTYLRTTGLVNNSAINMTGSGITFAGTWTNNGTITTSNVGILLTTMPTSVGMFNATGGSIDLYASATTGQVQQVRSSGVSWSLNDGATLNNSGGNLVLSKAGAAWAFYGGEIDGGTISSTDGTQLVVQRSLAYTFSSLVFDGVTVSTGVRDANFANPTIKNGLTLANNAVWQLGFLPSASAVMIFSGSQHLAGTGTILFNGDRGFPTGLYSAAGTLTIDLGISIVDGPTSAIVGDSNQGGIVSYGRISAQTSGYTVTINGPFTNLGTIEARSGGIIAVSNPALLTNLQSGNLVGGIWNVYAGSTLNLPSTSIATNAATVNLNGSGSNFAALDSFTSNLGTLTLAGGRVFSDTGTSLTNDGLLSVFAGSEFDVASLTQASDGTLGFELSKGTASNGVLVGTTISLAGTLKWSLAPGYFPATGDTFTILSGGSIGGTFSSVLAPPLPDGAIYSIVYTPNAVRLTFTSVPEPGSLGVISIAAAVGTRRRNRVGLRNTNGRTPL